MRPSEFNIIGASAGSGKTFAVTKTYLKIILCDKNVDVFMQILAITFTNKAVGEMKERILSSLKSFASDDYSATALPMLEAIEKETGLDREIIHKRSADLLVHLLHNYGGFEISTIDSFIHRIIRTFARDLDLPSNFEVELDQDDMLSRAVDQLISRADQKDPITPLLVEFALEKSDDDKSFDISYDLLKISKLLISDQDIPHLNKLKDKSLVDFSKWKASLNSNIKNLKLSISQKADLFFKILADHQIKDSDLSSGHMATYFEKIRTGNFNIDFDRAWQIKLINNEVIYPKRLSAEEKETIEQIQPQLSSCFQDSKQLILEFWLANALYKTLVPLSVLNALQSSLNQLKTDENKILISEFNTLISEEIKDQPTPYIFERLGEKFHHYFVDEFQDTSVMQWNNLIPLLDNSLSGLGNSATIVGDPKQAIYRWRGGDVSQFSGLSNGSANPFQTPISTQTLKYNFRSTKTIVEFNNRFFNYLSDFVFSDPSHAAIFKEASQEIINTTTGYIDFQFYDDADVEDKDSFYGNSVKERIDNCLERGYNYEDICILVRNNKQGAAIAENLGISNVPVSSSEALLLKNSPKVQFLLLLLELHVQPDNDLLKATFLYELANIESAENKHEFIETNLTKHFKVVIKQLYPEKKLNWLNYRDTIPLYDLMELYIDLFNYNQRSDAFIQFFLDQVLAHSLKRDGAIRSFLEYFYQNEEKLSISAPENRNAVSVMTIHKSKGLEFPIVIFPYAEVNIYEDRNSHIWIPIVSESNNGFEEAMLSVSSKLDHFSKEISNLYQSHKANLELDHINLLYVALTRPINELYILGKKDMGKKGPNLKSFSGLFMSYLETIGVWKNDSLHYTIGKPTYQEVSGEEIAVASSEMHSYPRNKEHFNVVTKSGLLWDSKQAQSIERGNLIHEILSHIRTDQDIPFAFNQLISEGVIRTSEVESLRALVHQVINHPQLTTYYSTAFKIYNETDLIATNNNIFRPDRLCITEDEAVIIDYKTGSPMESHGHQVSMYKSLLIDMGYKTVKGFLVYTNDDVHVVEV